MIAKWCGLLPTRVIVAPAVKRAAVDPALPHELFLQTWRLVPSSTCVQVPLMNDLLSGRLYAGLPDHDTEPA